MFRFLMRRSSKWRWIQIHAHARKSKTWNESASNSVTRSWLPQSRAVGEEASACVVNGRRKNEFRMFGKRQKRYRILGIDEAKSSCYQFIARMGMKRIEKIIGKASRVSWRVFGSRRPICSALMVGGKSERKQTRRKKESRRSLYIWNKITCVCVAASLLMIAIRLGIYIHIEGKAGWNSSPSL